jgi:hypothetical protein
MERCLACEADGRTPKVTGDEQGKMPTKFYLRSMSSTDFVDLFPIQNRKYADFTRFRALGGSKTVRLRGSDRIGLASEATLHGSDRVGLASEATLHGSDRIGLALVLHSPAQPDGGGSEAALH